MVVHFYDIFFEFIIVLIMLAIARYIFLEPEWKKYKRVFYIGTVIILSLGEFLLHSDVAMLLLFVCVGVYLFVARQKRKIRGLFEIVPIYGICCGCLYPIIILPKLLGLEKIETIYAAALDILTLVLLVIFWLKGKHWRAESSAVMKNRSLSKWERRLLNMIGCLLWLILISLDEMLSYAELTMSLRFHIGTVGLISMLLIFTVIGLIMQGNKTAHYLAVAELNKHYLELEEKHFRAYQHSQTETRRMRHDMKNHMLALAHLAQEEKLDELKKYIHQIGIEIEKSSIKLYTGNNFIDAIMSEKYSMAQNEAIHFEIEGQLAENLQIDSIDLCTVFSNALDNGIEAVRKLSESQRIIKILLAKQGNMVLLSFKNPIQIEEKVIVGRTTKQDKLMHGYGLYNIKKVVEKYQGDMTIETEEKEGMNYFVLEIVFYNV